MKKVHNVRSELSQTNEVAGKYCSADKKARTVVPAAVGINFWCHVCDPCNNLTPSECLAMALMDPTVFFNYGYWEKSSRLPLLIVKYLYLYTAGWKIGEFS